MEKALQDFYYQFHTKQHYFLCHDILEEAWKSNASFSKDDAIVSLVLMATGCYHFRRDNHRGAIKSFNKALKVIELHDNITHLGMDIDAYKYMLKSLIAHVDNGKPFAPIELPLTNSMVKRIMRAYPHFVMTTDMVTESYIVNHHLERDRSEVNEARQNALRQKQQRRL
ncbi:DUF309 domain-containing protein [Staphylococcus caeli]|uniref:Cytosolic protein n=1 Tax=Staphylococcus caeli TaxID=2201815 RepID=A0A1D4MYH1_9STAP|nr:DUF309 domain-containing protein [Staphylococcus caeli]SCT03465.1 Putative cytosolic protein [Staphylococcus caeli]SCT15686.1 Putative cytosolic protein [Staphylococcus caeli]